MLRLTTNQGEVLTVTAHRLVTWGASEREACALANAMLSAEGITLDVDSPDSVVEQAVIEVLVSAKQSVTGVVPEIEYVTGYRKDLQRRLEGRE